MTRIQKRLLALALALALLALGAGAAWLLSDAGARGDSSVAAQPVASAPADVGRGTAPGPRAVELVELAARPEGDVRAKSSVAWPVQVSLELVRAKHLPRAEGVKPLGTGKSARLQGRILDAAERGVPAEIRFVAGTNAGRVLRASASGVFGATDLYPGVSEVRVSGPGIPGSVREVRLSLGASETQLNISYGLPGAVFGSVYEGDSKPLEGVEVELDGQLTTTNADGEFLFTAMTSGEEMRLVLGKAGYATYTTRLGVPAGRTLERGFLKYLLLPAAKLVVEVEGRVGGPGEAEVVLLPEAPESERVYPWHRASPRRVIPGTAAYFDDLPPGRVSVRVYHAGAVAEPKVAIGTLRSGQTEHVTVHLKPAPLLAGTVKDERGLVVPGARVTLEAPDRIAAAMTHLASRSDFVRGEIVPTLAPAAQETATDDQGRFVLSSWAEFAPRRYLLAESADGKRWGGRVVGPEEKTVELVLTDVPSETAALELEFPGREQGLPVEVRVNGEALEPRVLAEDESLELEDLAAGTWRLRVVWNGQAIVGGRGFEELELDGERVRVVQLPREAIEGQDEDTRLRAGKAE